MGGIGDTESHSRTPLGTSTFRQFKVIQGHSKALCDFLLIRHSNLVFVFAIALYFGGDPVAPYRPCWGQCEQVP